MFILGPHIKLINLQGTLKNKMIKCEQNGIVTKETYT